MGKFDWYNRAAFLLVCLLYGMLLAVFLWIGIRVLWNWAD